MHANLTTWVSQVNDATGFLQRFYTDLRDPEQRARAAAAGTFAREFNRSAGRRPSTTPRPWIGLSPELAERTAWTSAIRGLLGLNILVALGGGSALGPKSLHTRLNQELCAAVRGFDVAFPQELVESDLDGLCEEAIQKAAETAEAAWKEVRLPSEADIPVGDFLRDEWLKEVRPGLHALLARD